MPQKGTYIHVQKKTSVEHAKLYFVFTAKASLPEATEVSVLGLLQPLSKSWRGLSNIFIKFSKPIYF